MISPVSLAVQRQKLFWGKLQKGIQTPWVHFQHALKGCKALGWVARPQYFNAYTHHWGPNTRMFAPTIQNMPFFGAKNLSGCNLCFDLGSTWHVRAFEPSTPQNITTTRVSASEDIALYIQNLSLYSLNIVNRVIFLTAHLPSGIS